ncbi:MAG: imelysin family protein [Bacteroidota bacterium]
MKIINYLCSLFLFVALLSSASCSKDSDDPTPTPEDPIAELMNSTLATEVKANYAELVYASYQDAYAEAEKLKAAIDAFLLTPDATTLEAAKSAWIAAREPYSQTEAYRFSNGPIDDGDGPEGFLNAWPLDESWIDYVEGNTAAGFINDPDFVLSKQALESENERGGENNISIGYHAIEFLLWGQDLSEPAAMQSGLRPHTDYLTDGTGTAANQDRRKEYLRICAELLLDHLQLLLDDWSPSGASNYRATFMSLDNPVAFKNILVGIGQMAKSELASERMNVALASQRQEDEQSCFSDNTHRDIRLNALGIKNVYTGTYARIDGSLVSGSSLSDLVRAIDATADEAVLNAISTAAGAIEATAIPFDLAISESAERDKVFTAVLNIQAVGDAVERAASALEL